MNYEEILRKKKFSVVIFYNEYQNEITQLNESFGNSWYVEQNDVAITFLEIFKNSVLRNKLRIQNTPTTLIYKNEILICRSATIHLPSIVNVIKNASK